MWQTPRQVRWTRGGPRDKKPAVTLLDHCASLPDPRIARHRWHKLSDLLVIAGCAVRCGAESFPAIEDFGREREEWLKHFLELPEGMPSHDTCNRVLRLLDPVQFQACFLSWRQAVAAATAGEVVAIDGVRRGAALVIKAGPSVRFTWSVRGRPPLGWCWGSARWTPKRTRSLPFLSYWTSWRSRGVW